ELAEFVTYHVFRDVHGDELVAVVHRERMAHELRRDRGRARPGFYDSLLVARIHPAHFLDQLVVDERPLLNGSRHNPSALRRGATALAAAHDHLVRLLLLTASLHAFRLAP